MNKSTRSRIWWIPLILSITLVALWWLTESTRPASGVTAAAKSIRPDYQLFAEPNGEMMVRTLFERDPAAADWLARVNHEFIQAVPLTDSEARRWANLGCSPADGSCAHVLYYNFSDGGTLEGVVNLDRGQVVDLWGDRGARPLASEHTLQTAAAIAMADEQVREVLGDFSPEDLMMVPMNIWLLDNACLVDWCVDLTFHDPSGSGEIFHVTVNLQQQEVARTFYTRGRPARPYRDISPQRDAFTDGCEALYGWSVCWEMTAHDGLDFTDATYQDQTIFSSAKIGQVEVWYPSWPGGYRDEIGTSASVPPYFDTVVTDLGNGFEVSQLFTEFTRWPNCICCYRYEQIMTFFEDGTFEASFVSHGPGCDDLSIYQPMWRIDLDLDGPVEDQAWVWNQGAWVEAIEEQEFELIFENNIAPGGEKLATFDGDLHYRWRYIPNDPLGLDEARMFLLQFREQEGDNPILTGPANTFQPPRQWLDGERVSRDNFVLWYVPLLKTKKGGPWWCMPEPGPDGTPCEATLRAEPAGPLPSAAELEALLSESAEAAAAATPTPPPTEAAVPTQTTETAEASGPGIEGDDAETLILNAGCAACHAIGEIGTHGKVGPDLSDIALVAAERVPELNARDYIRRAILFPDEFITPDCPNSPCLEGIMPDYYGARLTAFQLEMIVDYLMTQTAEGEPGRIGEESDLGESPSAVPLIPTVPLPNSAGSGQGPITVGQGTGLMIGVSIFVIGLLGVLLLIFRRIR